MTLPNSDLFIINRNRVNYQVDYESLKKYIPGMPAGSRCLFFMDTAPYGWTIDSGAKFTEASVRVVSGTGGGSDGSKNFSYVHKNWTTSVPTHNHSVSAGSHKHTGTAKHGHGISDPGHSHVQSRSGLPANNFRTEIEDHDNPMYVDGTPDGGENSRNYKVHIGSSSITNFLDEQDKTRSDFLRDAYDLIHDNELIEGDIWPTLRDETLRYGSTQGFVSVLDGLSNFHDGQITQEELNVIVQETILRIDQISPDTPTTKLSVGTVGICEVVFEGARRARNNNTCTFTCQSGNCSPGHSFVVSNQGIPNASGWIEIPQQIEAGSTYSYKLASQCVGGECECIGVDHKISNGGAQLEMEDNMNCSGNIDYTDSTLR